MTMPSEIMEVVRKPSFRDVVEYASKQGHVDLLKKIDEILFCDEYRSDILRDASHCDQIQVLKWLNEKSEFTSNEYYRVIAFAINKDNSRVVRLFYRFDDTKLDDFIILMPHAINNGAINCFVALLEDKKNMEAMSTSMTETIVRMLVDNDNKIFFMHIFEHTKFTAFLASNEFQELIIKKSAFTILYYMWQKCMQVEHDFIPIAIKAGKLEILMKELVKWRADYQLSPLNLGRYSTQIALTGDLSLFRTISDLDVVMDWNNVFKWMIHNISSLKSDRIPDEKSFEVIEWLKSRFPASQLSPIEK